MSASIGMAAATKPIGEKITNTTSAVKRTTNMMARTASVIEKFSLKAMVAAYLGIYDKSLARAGVSA